MLNPVLLISEVFYWYAERPGIHRRIIERVAEHRFYRGMETGVVADPSERKELRSLCERHGLTLLQWLTKSLLDAGVSLAAINDGEREQAVRCVFNGIDKAREAGAFAIGLVSGADPGPELRSRAQAAFLESAKAIAGYLGDRDMTLIIEPLDREQHKRQVLGPTVEGAELIGELRAINPRCGLCWDSAHVGLMGEDFSVSLKCAAGSALQMHLANAVIDTGSYFHGDHHFAPDGGIGFLDRKMMTELLREVVVTGAGGEGGITRVGVEARTLPGNDPWVNERNCRELLRASFDALGWEA